ncbi:hypothetical protein [Metallosphaera sp.]|uniref:hypothetical protein n=1 Tax=Metallosphaera sp. TaxID=2020860 RepID=UPI0031635F1D
MRYSPQLLILGSNPAMELGEKERIAREIIDKALSELETILFFIEDVLREVLEKVV